MDNYLVQGLKESGLEAHLAKSLQAAHAMARLNTDRLDAVDNVLKAMDTAETGAGAELVITQFDPTIINQVRLDLKVSSLFQHVPMASPTFKLPVEVGPATAYIVPENTADTGQTAITASNVGTGQVTFTATSLGAMVRISKELTQDSIVPYVPLIQRGLLRGLAVGLENALINGDTTGTHQDSDTTGSTNVAKAFKGLRKHALANNYKYDNGGGAITLSNMRNTRKLMGIYGVNPNDLVWIVGPSVYIQMLNIAEVLTMDKFGPNATVVTGQLAQVDGIPVVVSPHMRENLNASGVYDGTTTTKATAILAHREGFLIGDRQTIELDQDDTPKEYRQRKLLADTRVDFQPAHAIGSNALVAILFNIAA
jgi:hypothetical protein